MRALRVICIVLSVLFFFINVFAYIGLIGSGQLNNFFTPGGIIGYNFFFFVSALFAFLTWKLSKRIDRKKSEVLLDSLTNEIIKVHEKEINKR